MKDASPGPGPPKAHLQHPVLEERKIEEHYLRQNRCLFVCDDAGNVPQARKRMGLYYRGMRCLCGLRWTVDGQNLRALASSSEKNYQCEVWLTNPSLTLGDDSPLEPRLLAFHRMLVVWDGLHEQFQVRNCSSRRVALRLQLELASDFLDMMEIRGLLRRSRGRYLPVGYDEGCAHFVYEGADGIRRGVDIDFERPPDEVTTGEATFEIQPDRPELLRQLIDTRWETKDLSEASYKSGLELGAAAMPPANPLILVSRWSVELEPQEGWQVTWQARPRQDDKNPKVSFGFARDAAKDSYEDWLASCARITTSNDLLNELLHRALLDLKMLLIQSNSGPVPLAGLPWFEAVFGRDSLITGLQTLYINPELSLNILYFLAERQAQQDDPWRDAEPGKIPHEVRDGEMARLNEIPHGCYYGSVDATLLYLILFAETYNTIGPKDRLNRLFPAVERCISWIESHGRSPEDGYIRWERRSPVGIRNQGWKDSRSSLCDARGRPVGLPVALVEVQGYAYRAYRSLASVIRRRSPHLARKLDQWAEDLQARFRRDFWLHEQGYLAQALGPNGDPVRSITSNAGQVLFSGLLDQDTARRVAERLMENDMFSGWGIRTLSQDDRTYNPMSYHNGSVWHHDTALIAAGLWQHGFVKEATMVTRGLFEASQFLGRHPFPELICGFERSEGLFSVPGDYPASCPIQAWAAGSLFQVIQGMLGLRVSNKGRRLHVAPELPDWLRSVCVERLSVGGNRMSIYFTRDEAGRSMFKILENPGEVEVVVTS